MLIFRELTGDEFVDADNQGHEAIESLVADTYGVTLASCSDGLAGSGSATLGALLFHLLAFQAVFSAVVATC
jgi:hypothetical protein